MTTHQAGLDCQYCGIHDALNWSEPTRQGLIDQIACHSFGPGWRYLLVAKCYTADETKEAMA